ncbi:hypothetical protein [Mariniflexile sp. HMF6888]|uniref:hypothetical protein n=1 Tax=Mariniflexile sp. HMF6888 TaxID=3373086 RepID=UPI0037A165BA
MRLVSDSKDILKSEANFNYVYRVNSGCDDYLRFPNALKTNVSGSFISKENAHAYTLLHGEAYQLASWLEDYEKIADTAQNSKGISFYVFRKEVKKG